MSEAIPAAAPQTIVQVVTVPQARTGIAYLWWLFFGALGAHQFYMGNTGRAISYIFTLGWLTVGLWIDLFTMSGQVRKANARRLAETNGR